MIITLTTDFGPGPYVAAMKGVILEIDPEATIVDLDHSVDAQDIRQGAYAILSAAPYFPFAIHVGVVDPGVGTARRAIAIACEGARFVGPDNGLLIPAANAFGIKEVRHLTNHKYMLERASYVFHGRDVFAPVAAHLSKGAKLADLGPTIDDYVRLDFGTPQADDTGIRGEVLTVDRFGNIITNIPRWVISERWRFNQDFDVSIGGWDLRLRLVRTYGEAMENALLLTISSSNFLELARRSGSAAGQLGVRARDPVALKSA
ncbi:MAG TPA: SAM-dependent chlorinase/fluorinase [Thermoplasmata archaeon]|nr:SAM-dependent chlorinase/fluorinase [Thermoplasmata archaeon]